MSDHRRRARGIGSRIARAFRVGAALLRIGFAEAAAYRFQMIIWALTITMPLVSLALWSAVAAVAPVGRYTQAHFVAYFLGALVVRQVTGSSLAAVMNYEIRTGQLSVRLLRPIHALFGYGAQSLASLPLRAAPSLVISALGLLAATTPIPPLTPGRLGLLALAMAGAWMINFSLGVAIGSLAFFMESSTAVSEMWRLAFLLLSGYLVPLELLPAPLRAASDALPFYYAVAFPVEIWVFALPAAAVWRGLLAQAAWVVACGALGLLAWRAGERRFSAYGG